MNVSSLQILFSCYIKKNRWADCKTREGRRILKKWEDQQNLLACRCTLLWDKPNHTQNIKVHSNITAAGVLIVWTQRWEDEMLTHVILNMIMTWSKQALSTDVLNWHSMFYFPNPLIHPSYDFSTLISRDWLFHSAPSSWKFIWHHLKNTKYLVIFLITLAKSNSYSSGAMIIGLTWFFTV